MSFAPVFPRLHEQIKNNNTSVFVYAPLGKKGWMQCVMRYGLCPFISKTNALSNQPTTVSTINTKCNTVDCDVGHMIDTVSIIKSVRITIL